jgi:predicted unusual protein kinase regulating ubiquinone biosynthesis (AarF/ABC1/UbiB family)
MEEIIKRMNTRIMNHQKENGFETIFDFLNEDINELQEKLCNLDFVSGSFSADIFVEILKKALEGNDEVKVEFENEADNINYVLDVCNNFKKELEKKLPLTVRLNGV